MREERSRNKVRWRESKRAESEIAGERGGNTKSEIEQMRTRENERERKRTRERVRDSVRGNERK